LSEILDDSIKTRLEAGTFELPEGVDEKDVIKHLYTTFPEFLDANTENPALSPEDWKALGISSGDPNLIYPDEEIKIDALLAKLGTVEGGVSEVAVPSPDLTEGAVETIDSSPTETATNQAGDETMDPPAEALETVADTGDEAEAVAEPETEVQPVGPPVETSPLGADAPESAVPDYTGNEVSAGDSVAVAEDLPEDLSESVPPEPAEAPATNEDAPEAVSGQLREVSEAEVKAKQMADKEFFANHRHAENGMLNTEYLADRDAVAGYEPVYTAALSERVVDVTPNDIANIERGVPYFIGMEMVKAYHAGEIDLPLQWTYLLDTIADKRGGLDSILDGSTNWDRGELGELTQLVAEDMRFLNDLSRTEIRELGFSSGVLTDADLGDRIKTGDIIKRVMQNAAERINE
jgi:hypothetical protein